MSTPYQKKITKERGQKKRLILNEMRQKWEHEKNTVQCVFSLLYFYEPSKRRKSKKRSFYELFCAKKLHETVQTKPKHVLCK